MSNVNIIAVLEKAVFFLQLIGKVKDAGLAHLQRMAIPLATSDTPLVKICTETGTHLSSCITYARVSASHLTELWKDAFVDSIDKYNHKESR